MKKKFQVSAIDQLTPRQLEIYEAVKQLRAETGDTFTLDQLVDRVRPIFNDADRPSLPSLLRAYLKQIDLNLRAAGEGSLARTSPIGRGHRSEYTLTLTE